MRKGQSRWFKDFVEEIQFKNRNPRDVKVLEALNDKKTNTTMVLKVGEELYRSRIIKDKNNIGKQRDFYGYDAKQSFVSPKEATKDMRANYRYIPYLYVSSSPLASIYEIRPRYGADVSVATVRVKEKLEILDFTMTFSIAGIGDAKQNLFNAISECFSKPITEEDDTLDYIPTQYIAEYAKNLGYDGIAFKSSVFSKKDQIKASSINFVIFNYYKTEVIKSNVVEISQVSYSAEQVDNDQEKILEKEKELISNRVIVNRNRIIA